MVFPRNAGFDRCYLVSTRHEISYLTSTSETKGQIVGARESLNGRKNKAGRKVKNGEKSYLVLYPKV